MHRTILNIDGEKYELNYLTPFVIALVDLVYDGNFSSAEKDLKNTKLKNELKTVKKLSEIYSDIILPEIFSPIDYTEFNEYLLEANVNFSNFKNGTYNGFIDKIMSLANNGDYKSAQKFLDALKDSNLQKDIIFELIGTLYLEEGEIEKGINFLKESIKINPNSDTAYSELGNAYYNEKKFNLAAECWLKEIKISPNHLYAYFMVHDSFKKCDKRIDAKNILEKLLKKYPDNLLAKYHLMEYYCSIKNIDMVNEIKNEILNSIPGYSNDFEIWSEIQYEKENYIKVVEAIDKYLSTNPNSSYLNTFKIVPLIKMNRYIDAIMIINQLKENDKWYYYGKNDFFSKYLTEKERKICGIS